MKTYHKTKSEVKRDWHAIDASTAPVGRIAARVAGLLMGKHKPDYSAHLDMGDYVIVTNAKALYMTGGKEQKKKYYKHSGYPGGFAETPFAKYKTERPEKIIQLAVRGMLPKNRLRAARMTRLKIFEDKNHPHEEKTE